MPGVLLAVAISIGLASFCRADAAVAGDNLHDPVDAGSIVVVDVTDPSQALTEWDSSIAFAVRLPDEATCPGDSYNDSWRVQSFILPVADDVASVLFSGVGPEGPEGDTRWPLRQVNGFNYVDELTAKNPAAGLPGLILGLPAFSTVSFDPDELPPGRYRIGIACTLDRRTAKYWDTEIIVTAGAPGQSAGLVWGLDPSAQDPTAVSGGGNSWWVPLGLGVSAIVVGFAVHAKTNRSQSTSRLKEQR